MYVCVVCVCVGGGSGGRAIHQIGINFDVPETILKRCLIKIINNDKF